MFLARVIMRKVVQNGQGYAIRVVIDGGAWHFGRCE